MRAWRTRTYYWASFWPENDNCPRRPKSINGRWNYGPTSAARTWNWHPFWPRRETCRVPCNIFVRLPKAAMGQLPRRQPGRFSNSGNGRLEQYHSCIFGRDPKEETTMWTRMTILCLAAVLLAAASRAQPAAGKIESQLALESSDARLVEGFNWAKRQAMAYVFDRD